MWDCMNVHYQLTGILVWIFSGGIWNIVAFYYMVKARRHYRKVVEPELVSQGEAMMGFFDTVNKYGISGWIPLFIIVNIITFMLSVGWRVGLPIYLIILVLVFLGWSLNYIDSNFCQDEHKVTRFLKKNPQMVTTILENEDHTYYKIAKRLHASGVIVIDKSVQMISIDGKDYKIEVK